MLSQTENSDNKTTCVPGIEQSRFRGVDRVLQCDVVVDGRTNTTSSLRAKHINTSSYHFWAVTMNELSIIMHCYMDRGCMYERNGVKKIVLCGLQVEIINIHVFTHHPGLVY